MKFNLLSHSFFLYFTPKYPANMGDAINRVRNISDISGVVSAFMYIANIEIHSMPNCVPYFIAACVKELFPWFMVVSFRKL